jgi:hypothetical protein
MVISNIFNNIQKINNYIKNETDWDHNQKDSSKKSEKNVNGYYKCNYTSLSIGGYIDILNNNNFLNTLKNNWKIWFPHGGYNNIDEKLKKLKIKNKDQIIFAIPNSDNIVSKYNVCKTLYKQYGEKIATKIIPPSYLLDNKSDIEKIQIDENIKYILKKKIQRKEGLKITSNKKDIINGYKNDYLIAQKLIEPFLVKDRKINLRIYLMIVIENNTITAYVNKYGTCIYTKNEYDNKSYDFESQITSYNMDIKLYNDYPLTLEQFKTYLNDNNHDYNEFFNKINNSLTFFLNAFKDQIGNDKKFINNKCAQVFGVDFIIDKNLNPILLECNKGPDMKPKIRVKNDPDITTEIIDKINELTNNLSNNDISNNDKLLLIKKVYKNIYKNYPKSISTKTILNKINQFYDNEKKLSSYPTGYISGCGLKVQQDSLEILNILNMSKNNGFEKIIEIKN